MSQAPANAAEELYEEMPAEWQEEAEHTFESFPPECLFKAMSDALERLKNFEPHLP